MENYCYLGRGIDVVYAPALSTKHLKRSILKEATVDKTNYHSLNKTTYDVREVINSSLYETIKSVEIDANVNIKFAAFSGGLEYKYSRKQSAHACCKYCRMEAIRLQSKYFLKAMPSKLASELDPMCSRALNDETVSPSDIFDIYGTHLIAGYKSGAKMEIFAEYQSDVGVSDTQLSSALKFSLNGIYSMNASAQEQTTYNQIMNRTNLRVNCTGGEAATSFSLFTAKDFQKNMKKWAKSLKNLEFSIAQVDKYIPIWVLAKSVERQRQLEQAFIYRVKKREKEIVDFCAPLKTGFYKVRLSSIEDVVQIGYGLFNEHSGSEWSVYSRDRGGNKCCFKFTRADNGTYRITAEGLRALRPELTKMGNYLPVFGTDNREDSKTMWELVPLTDRLYQIRQRSGSAQQYLTAGWKISPESFGLMTLNEKKTGIQAFELIRMDE